MDKNQIVAIAGSFLIASAGVAGVRAWANASARATLQAPAASVESIQTLAPVEVRPTRDQLRMLQPQASSAPSSDSASAGGGVAMDMPYYSFGAAARRASRG